jgi:hypothetical protein
MSIVGDIIGGLKGSHAATHAANTMSDAALQAQKLEESKAQNALDAQNQIWSGTQENLSPYTAAGKTSVNNLANLVNNPATFQYGQFQAPTLEQARNMPGYQFQLQQGVDALDKSAAARGNLFSGNQGVALQQYGQGLADTSYNNLYNQALQTYMTNYGVHNQGLQEQIGALGGLSGQGLSAAGTEGSLGQATAGNIGNINMRTAEDQAQQINNAAAARASGYLGKAAAQSNMWGGILGGVQGGFGNLDTSGGSSPWEQALNFGTAALGFI